jgi:hypothetical protein
LKSVMSGKKVVFSNRQMEATLRGTVPVTT